MQMALYSFVLYRLLSWDKIVSSGKALYLLPKIARKKWCTLIWAKSRLLFLQETVQAVGEYGSW